MSSKIRKCVRELERGEEIDVLLPEYAKQYMIAQDSLSRIRMMMEYYMFYEMISRGTQSLRGICQRDSGCIAWNR